MLGELLVVMHFVLELFHDAWDAQMLAADMLLYICGRMCCT